MTEIKKNEIVAKLLDIDILINDIGSFMAIKMRIESLDQKSPACEQLLDYVDTVLRVIQAFAKAGLTTKENLKGETNE